MASITPNGFTQPAAGDPLAAAISANAAASEAALVTAAPGTEWTEDWASADGSAWPTGWTTSAATADTQSGLGRLVTASTAYAAASGRLPGPTDGELVVKWSMTTSTERYARIGCRVLNDQNLYRLEVGSSTLLLEKVVGGTRTTLASVPNRSFDVNRWYWARLNWRGAALRARVWVSGEAEPKTWEMSATDTSFTAGNNVALYGVTGAAGVQQALLLDSFRLWRF